MARKIFLLFWLFPTITIAAGDCFSLAKTPLEKTYCQIGATPEAGNLPSFSDFRRNDPQIQALLLKGPARRLGIEVPSASVARPVASRQKTSPPPPRTATVVQPPAEQAVTRKANRPNPPVASPGATRQAAIPQNALANCQFHSEEIRCAQHHYRLVNNRQNHQLAAGVLSADNVLALAPFTGNPNDTSAVNSYLAESYERYIEKMLLIGLGGSTMSYTKFHYTYWELAEKGEDFAGRVGQMYHYLKQDKATMAVKARYDGELPESIAWCQGLSATIIVCDNSKKNWVYSSTPPK